MSSCGSRLFWVLLAVAAMGLRMAAYGRSVHEGLTRYLALSAGINEATAKEIARADQGTDSGSTGPWASVESRRLYHFVSARRLSEFRAQAFGACAPGLLGQYFHALEDAFSHEGYGSWAGHFPDLRPDRHDLDPDRAERMAQTKFSELQSLRTACPNFTGNPPKKWDDIRSTVRSYLRQRNPPALPDR